jgi:hypothetical protein
LRAAIGVAVTVVAASIEALEVTPFENVPAITIGTTHPAATMVRPKGTGPSSKPTAEVVAAKAAAQVRTGEATARVPAAEAPAVTTATTTAMSTTPAVATTAATGQGLGRERRGSNHRSSNRERRNQHDCFRHCDPLHYDSPFDSRIDYESRSSL